MSEKSDAKKRMKLLKQLREEHADTVARTQERLKEQNAMRKAIRHVLSTGPKTVLDVADATNLPSHQVLWHLTAMKKYDLVEEAEIEGEYYLYRLPLEKSS
jgi:predicted transcriptional regulator